MTPHGVMGPPGQTLLQRLSSQGLAKTARDQLSWARARAIRRITHRHRTPTLAELARVCRLQTTRVETFVKCASRFRASNWGGYRLEYRERVRPALDAAYASARLTHPTDWAIEDAEGEAYYCLLRALRPRHVTETGVANGHSTFVVLSALDDNGRGTLTSVDVSDGVGALVPERLRGIWRLVVMGRRSVKRELRAELNFDGPCDVFIHDSDHSYGWQAFEYATAWPNVRTGGLLLSDDVDTSYAFRDFVSRTGADAFVLVCKTKPLGAVLKPEP